ncbi:MAG: Toxin Doc [Firmicutes bacterium]|nr:Toxin Doc [Bacillota bacterium]
MDQALSGKAPRDLGLLESAVNLPRQPYYTTLFIKAAAMFRSLVKNHPFIDGNKRTGLLGVKIFLLDNRYRLTCSDDDIIAFTLAVARGEVRDLEEIARWFEHCTERCPRHSRSILRQAMNLCRKGFNSLDSR